MRVVVLSSLIVLTGCSDIELADNVAKLQAEVESQQSLIKQQEKGIVEMQAEVQRHTQMIASQRETLTDVSSSNQENLRRISETAAKLSGELEEMRASLNQHITERADYVKNDLEPRLRTLDKNLQEIVTRLVELSQQQR